MKRVTTTTTRSVPPVLTAWLAAMWLLLNQTVSVGQIVLGTVLAVVLAISSRTLRPLQPKLRRVGAAIPLLALALLDIVRSNVAVAGIVLGLVRDREIRSGFVKIPLELTDPHGLATLAGIVTSTPGTVWVNYDAGSKTLTLHVLDLVDEAEWIDWVKNRYERLLLRIFE